MKNADLSLLVLNGLEKMHAQAVCICPGARNSPLVEKLSESSFEKFYFFDERAASFFALGRARSTGKPVAVVTTSGTAAGELLPAMMEAHYSCLPLVAITADRPRHYRGTGAPQAAEQVGIYSHYASTLDWDVKTKDFNLIYDPSKPLHLNICFDEPLLDQPSLPKDLKFTLLDRPRLKTENLEKMNVFLKKFKHPFAILGGLSLTEAKAVENFLKKSQIPFYSEGISQLRHSSDLENQRITNADGLINKAKACDYPIDGVLRIGDVPTHRVWRDLDVLEPIPVLSISSKPFSGLPECDLICENLNLFFDSANPLPFDSGKFEKLKKQDEEEARKLIARFNNLPLSEQAQFYFLSQKLADKTKVYVGNSLPIRHWDLSADAEKEFEVFASRGLNGIDGQISYFLGALKSADVGVAIVGDLTALYDLQAPWVLDQLKQKKFKIIIINNSGGKIFERMFKKKEYLNEHNLDFSHWARFWSMSYQAANDVREIDLEAQVIELKPNNEQSRKFGEVK